MITGNERSSAERGRLSYFAVIKMDQLVKGMSKDKTLLIAGLVDTETVERARSIHNAYPTAAAALGRAISGAVLLSSLLKNGQKIIVQITGDGPIQEIVAEADWLSRVRVLIKRPHIHLELKDGKLDVGRAVGKGVLTVIKDLGLREYYRGSVPLQSGEIATDLAYYLNVSEQIPAAVSLGVYVDTDNKVKASGGFMIQALPGASDDTVSYLEERLRGVKTASAMILDGFGPEKVMEEATGMPLDILEKRDVSYYCPCSKERVMDALVAIGKNEIEELIRKDETASIQCQFCRTEYAVTQEELSSLLKAIERPENDDNGESGQKEV